MKSNVVRMTLTNESITFTTRGVWIQPVNSDGFWFAGTASELISIMVFHHELDIENTLFYVIGREN